MNFERAEISFSATVDEDVIGVTRCEVTERVKNMGRHAIEHRRRRLQALGHDESLREHTAGSADSRERNAALSHQNLIEAIGEVDGAIDDAARHGVQYHVLTGDLRLHRDGGVIQLVEGVDDAPSAGGLFTQKVGVECGEILSRTWPAFRRPSKMSSIALTRSRGSGHCRVSQCSEPGARSISWRTPRPAGSSAGILSKKTSAKS
ncbi:hypothetical protein PR003_g7213 [Phytophthora rubi]|uniref:Uncharacterized protein n=1 Tax=Phytophthora rubi TaxID=129364 RepID=A0A6A4G0M0_9STRA|nr:hypothetical protein PR003_g7213 [Phytophthora rubi]